jgi:RNA 3'-terminal phosphate cyclase
MESKGYVEEIKAYLNKNLDKGYKLGDLEIQLKKNGYSPSAISRAVLEVEKERNKKKIEVKEEVKEEKIEVISEPERGFFSKVKNLFK